MRASTWFGPVVLSALMALATAAQAQYVLDVEQNGADVVATGTGSINTAGLISLGGFYSGYPAGFIQDFGQSVQEIYTGGTTAGNGFGGLSGPEYFLNDSGNADFLTSIGGGDGVGILGGSLFSSLGPVLLLEPTYISGTAINSQASWADESLTSLGLLDGTYIWTWDGGLGSFTLDVGLSPIPEPGSLPMLASFLALGAAAYRTRRVRRPDRP